MKMLAWFEDHAGQLLLAAVLVFLAVYLYTVAWLWLVFSIGFKIGGV